MSRKNRRPSTAKSGQSAHPVQSAGENWAIMTARYDREARELLQDGGIANEESVEQSILSLCPDSHEDDTMAKLQEAIRAGCSPEAWKLYLKLETLESERGDEQSKVAYLLGIAVGMLLRGSATQGLELGDK